MFKSQPSPILMLGAHRWRRQHTVPLAKSLGFEPWLLAYEEIIDEELLAAVGDDLIIRLNPSLPFPLEDITNRLAASNREWFVTAFDDYVCEQAAALSLKSAQVTMLPSAARETFQKHLLRQTWNGLATKLRLLYPVPFQMLRFSNLGFTSVVQKIVDPAFDAEAELILKPDALDASIGI